MGIILWAVLVVLLVWFLTGKEKPEEIADQNGYDWRKEFRGDGCE